jgi:potassium uptake TrkH family protein
VLFVVAAPGLVAWLRPTAAAEGPLGVLQAWSLADLYLGCARLYIFVNAAIRFLRAHERLLDTGIRPVALFVGSFGILILIGTLLLALPRASATPSRPIRPLDAFFTATSAVCVTGLTVLDTEKDFSRAGQAVILCLIQVGGLGIVTFVALMTVLSGKAFSVPEMVAMREMVSARAYSDVRKQIVSILAVTLVIEGLGAGLLYLTWHGITRDPFERAFWCTFHAVSAFCNAGIGMASDSLVSVSGNWGVILTITAMIVLGGLGFPVFRDILAFRFWALPWVLRWRFFRRRHSGRSPARLNVQSKLAIATTVALILVGAFTFWCLESDHALRGKSASEQAAITLLQAVTPRTAGFSSVPFDQLRQTTLLAIMCLMAIGACPVSTGGGIKTVTFAVLLLTIRSFLRGRDRVEVLGRTIPRHVVHAAISVTMVYVATAVLVTFVLLLTNPGIPLEKLAFEAISALSTVGLSTGVTASLSASGKLVLCLAMFAGRVGPLTLVMAVVQSRAPSSQYRYPDEDVIVG